MLRRLIYCTDTGVSHHYAQSDVYIQKLSKLQHSIVCVLVVSASICEHVNISQHYPGVPISSVHGELLISRAKPKSATCS
jgi:hypothetical protein